MAPAFLFLDKPIQKLHGAEILHGVCRFIDGMDKAVSIDLMLQAFLKIFQIAFQLNARLINGFQRNLVAAIPQIPAKKHGMIPFPFTQSFRQPFFENLPHGVGLLSSCSSEHAPDRAALRYISFPFMIMLVWDFHFMFFDYI